MKRKLLSLLVLTISGYTLIGQDLSYCDSLKLKIKHDKDTLPKFDVFMKDRWYGISFNSMHDKNYSFGVGYYLYSVSSRYRHLPSPSFETNINYQLNGYLYHNFTIKIPLLIEPSLNFCTYTDFKNTSFFIRPGLGLDAWVVNINYYFNFRGIDNIGINSKHNISLYIRPGIIKNVWKDATFICLNGISINSNET